MGHTLTDNHNGLVVNAMLTQVNGYAEREAAKVMMIIDARQAHEEETTLTLGADKGYDAKEFIEALQEMNVLPHVAQNKFGRKSVTRFSGCLRWIRGLSGKAQADRAKLWLIQDCGAHEGWCDDWRGDQMFVLTMTTCNLTLLNALGQLRLQGALE